MTTKTMIGFAILLALLAWSWFRLLRLVIRIERQTRELEQTIKEAKP